MMLFYDFIRLFRRLIRHSVFAIAVEDILYWLVCGICIFRMLYLENNGAVRGFAIAAVALGMLVYLQFGKFLNKARKKLQKAVKKVIIHLKFH